MALHLLALIPTVMVLFGNIYFLWRAVGNQFRADSATYWLSLVSNILIQTIGASGLIAKYSIEAEKVGNALILLATGSVNLMGLLMFLLYIKILANFSILDPLIMSDSRMQFIKRIGCFILGINVIYTYTFYIIYVLEHPLAKIIGMVI